MNANEVFPNRLKTLRLEKNLSLEELANKVGTTKVTLSRYESGKRSPNIGLVSDLANFFNVDIQWLAGLDDPSSNKNELINLFNKLSTERQNDVIKYTEEQLSEQNKIIPIKIPKDDGVMAAHDNESGRVYSAEENEAIEDFLEVKKQKFLAKNKQCEE